MSRLIVSPDAVVRVMGGRWWVHTGGPQKSFAADDAVVLTLLDRFRTGADTQVVLESLDDAERAAAERLISTLERIGALVPAERTAVPGDAPLVDTHIRPLIAAVHDLAGDVAAFGSAADGLVARASEVSLRTRLTALLAGVTAVKATLAALRRPYLAAQLARLDPSAARGVKLHLGAGAHRIPGWINVDLPPADLALDLRWGLPFRDGDATHIHMSHVLEHFHHPSETLPLLSEIHRVLAPGGRLRVVVPDIEQCLRAYVAGDDRFFEARRATWTWWPAHHTRLEAFLSYAGVGPRPEDALDAHRSGFDFDTLADALRRCGFTSIERSSFMASADPVLRVDEASAVAAAAHEGIHYSLFVEAVRRGQS